MGRMPPRESASFTGREDVLGALHAALGTRRTAALAAPPSRRHCNGMPGDWGRPSTAVEYASRALGVVVRRSTWVLVADSPEGQFASNLAGLAGELGLALPEAESRRSRRRRSRRCGTGSPRDRRAGFSSRTTWKEPRDSARRSLPHHPRRGRVLDDDAARKRRRSEGVTVEIRLKLDSTRMTGALLLLRRADRATPAHEPDEVDLARDAEVRGFWVDSAAHSRRQREVSQAFDGLPLALEHAGAYVLDQGRERRRSTCGSTIRAQRTANARRSRGPGGPHGDDHGHLRARAGAGRGGSRGTARRRRNWCGCARSSRRTPFPKRCSGARRPSWRSRYGASRRTNSIWPEVVEAATRYALLSRDPDGRTLVVAPAGRGRRSGTGWTRQARRAGTLAAVRALNCGVPCDVEYGTWDVCARLLASCARLARGGQPRGDH